MEEQFEEQENTLVLHEGHLARVVYSYEPVEVESLDRAVEDKQRAYDEAVKAETLAVKAREDAEADLDGSKREQGVGHTLVADANDGELEQDAEHGQDENGNPQPVVVTVEQF